MSAQHTPGPWVALPDPNAISPDDWCIGAQGQIDKVAVCSERDARLIAAAPDLLEALHTARDSMLDRGVPVAPDHPHRLALQQVESAIAKATTKG